MKEALFSAITNLDKKGSINTTKELLQNKIPPQEILDVGRKAMQVIGEHFESGEYFLPELMVSGDILAAIATEVKPYLERTNKVKKIAKVVIGTVAGDIHDIAKDIVAFILDINGFDVIDLGVDVPIEKFVDAVQEHQAKIVGLSGFLTLAIEPMRDTISALKGAGLTDVKVMIGGGPINQLVCDDIGADDWGANAVDAVKIAKGWVGETE